MAPAFTECRFTPTAGGSIPRFRGNRAEECRTCRFLSAATEWILARGSRLFIGSARGSADFNLCVNGAYPVPSLQVLMKGRRFGLAMIMVDRFSRVRSASFERVAIPSRRRVALSTTVHRTSRRPAVILFAWGVVLCLSVGTPHLWVAEGSKIPRPNALSSHPSSHPLPNNLANAALPGTAASPTEPSPTEPSPAQARPSTAQQVRSLTAAEMAKKPMVRIEGVVTFAGGPSSDAFIQDKTAGIYLSPRADLLADLKVGDRVRVEGIPSPSTFAPCLIVTSATKIGHEDLPNPEFHGLDPDDNRWLDARWIEARAHVQSVGEYAHYWVLYLANSRGVASASVPKDQLDLGEARKLTNCVVRIRGVCNSPVHDSASGNALPQGRFLIPTRSSIEVLSESPVRPRPLEIDHGKSGFLNQSLPFSTPVTFKGLVTHRTTTHDGAAQKIYLENQDGAIHATGWKQPDVRVNDVVSIVGYLEPASVSRLVSLSNASFEIETESRLTLQPKRAAAAQLEDPALWGRRVSVEGTLERIDQGPTGGSPNVLLTLLHDEYRFHVTIQDEADPGSIPKLTEGMRLRLVCTSVPVLEPELLGSDTYRLLVLSDDDIVILAQPPPPSFWTADRIRVALGILAGLFVLAGIWVVSLRRQLRRQTDQIRQQFARAAELELSLQEQRRLQAVGRLVSGIAHDFNNLLAVITSGRELLGFELPSDHPAQEYVGLIGQAATRGAELTHQLLAFASDESTESSEIDLSETVRGAESLIQRTIGSRIQVRGSCPPEPILVEANRGAIIQLLLNLAANAREAMPDGGDLTLTLKKNEAATKAELRVQDSGCGMDSETQTKIFEPFYTTKQVGQGPGLGLATAFGTVRDLGGTIRVESEPGVGTSFIIELPISGTVTPESVVAESNPIEVVSQEAGTVLLVEDSEPVRIVIRAALRRFGFEVCDLGDPIAAVALFEEDPERFAILVTDAVMPGMGGPELAARLRERRPELPVVVVSGHSREELPRVELLHPEDGYLRKPFPPIQLVGAIHSTLSEA